MTVSVMEVLSGQGGGARWAEDEGGVGDAQGEEDEISATRTVKRRAIQTTVTTLTFPGIGDEVGGGEDGTEKGIARTRSTISTIEGERSVQEDGTSRKRLLRPLHLFQKDEAGARHFEIASSPRTLR